MVNVTGYAYPWDYLDDAATFGALELGVDTVALAANYHATRLVTPLHGRRRVLDVPHSAMYAPIRPKKWRDLRLKPQQPAWLGLENSFNDAARRFAAAGLPVLAWIVVAHEDDLGVANPDLTVRNAFGESYPYALCPAQDDVRAYASTLVAEVMATTEATGVVLEACGSFGVEHGSVHDKSDLAALNDPERQLLSVCFCDACREGLADHDIDPGELASTVRAALAGPVESIESVLGGELTARVASYRSGLSSALRRELAEQVRAARADATVSVHASASPWATGSFPALGAVNDARELESVVANCWNHATAEREIEGLAHHVGRFANLGAYVRADRVADSPAETVEHFRHLGVSELHLYHLGLLNRLSRAVAEALVAACHRAGSTPAAYDS
ncbi:MAG: hypothetical protein WCA31_06935 [Acidimicrobiales bacterium]